MTGSVRMSTRSMSHSRAALSRRERPRPTTASSTRRWIRHLLMPTTCEKARFTPNVRGTRPANDEGPERAGVEPDLLRVHERGPQDDPGADPAHEVGQVRALPLLPRPHRASSPPLPRDATPRHRRGTRRAPRPPPPPRPWPPASTARRGGPPPPRALVAPRAGHGPVDQEHRQEVRRLRVEDRGTVAFRQDLGAPAVDEEARVPGGDEADGRGRSRTNAAAASMPTPAASRPKRAHHRRRAFPAPATNRP